MTDVEQAPPQNGIDTLAGEDKDNNAERPADIQQDMREMERRKRVEAIMGSKLFREELERIVDSAREGGGTSGILQQLSDIVGIPASRVGSVYKANNCMLPINDIRGVESMGYAKGEKILRCKLAATFRLLDIFGWTQGGLGAQITARLKVDQEYFLVNPYGLMYHEITASSLNKVDMQGLIVEQGTTNFGVNRSHFALHSAVHAARPDIRCVIYIGCSPVVAISSLRTGLLPLTKDACVLGEITTHPYSGSLSDAEERDRLVRNLGPNSKVILLSNHGALCCGETIEEAFYAACHIVQACETQLKLLPVGLDNLVLIPEETRKTIYEQARRPPDDLEKHFAAAVTIGDEEAADKEAAPVKERVLGNTPKWRVGGAEFEGLMRMLDNAGYRTGYIYRHPLIKSEPPKPKSDVELPPAVSSLGYLLEEEEFYRQGIWKKGDLRKGGDRSKWLNSPNVYQKVEVLETGTPDPKKITKWVADGSPSHSTPVRIEDALQFVPTGTSTKEFKRLQQQIKDNRRADKISAGPQSHILEGVTWDEANRLKEGNVSNTGDHVVLMGAASKGIIQRGFQHNAAVYKAPYAKNPFDNVTDDELNEYKRTVERKKKSIHGEYTDTDFSESEPLSSLQTSGGQKQTTTTTTAAAVSHSEPEDREHQVLRIQTQQAPVPSQAEVVMSDANNNNNKQNGKAVTDEEEVIDDIKIGQKVAAEENKEEEKEEEEEFSNKYLFYIDKTKQLHNNMLMKEMKNTTLFKRQLHNIDSDIQVRVVDSGNTKDSELQAEIKPRNINLQEPLPRNSNMMGHFLFPNIKRAHGKQRIDIDSNENEPLYDLPIQNQHYEQSVNCKRPQSCNAIFQSLYNTNELDPQLLLNLPWSTASTPCMNTPRNIRYREAVRYVSQLNQPYRTVSHFGFNLPTQLSQPEHKHIPQNATIRNPVLTTACSYDDVYGSPRYVDLCNQCYEQLLRLKPDFIPVRTRLRNLADIPTKISVGSQSTETTQETLKHTLIYEAATAVVETAGLETVLEVDENKSSEVETTKNNAEENSQSSFERRISNFNFSKESTNIHYEPPLIADSVLSMEIQSFNENNQTEIVDPTKCKVEIFEVIEFGNWMKADGVLDCQYRSSSEKQADNDIIMTRNERLERKAEFQDLWEDHINFFTGKEKAMLEEAEEQQEEAEEEEVTDNTEKSEEILNEQRIEEVYRPPAEVEEEILEKEVFLGCSLIVHDLKNVETSEETAQITHQSTPFFHKSVPNYILHGNNNTLDMDDDSVSDDSKVKDTSSKKEEFVSLKGSELSFERMNFNTTQTSDNENAVDASDEISLNSVEYEILEKIGLNKLKEKSQIFEKIDQTVRNKLTPKRINELLQKEQEKNANDDEQPTTSAKAMSNFMKFMQESKENVNDETYRLNTMSSCSTFSISSNREEEEVIQQKNLSKSSNTSIFSHQSRGKRTQRNFIRENIKNASKPRNIRTPVKCCKHKENLHAIFSPCPFGDVEEKHGIKKRKKCESSTSSNSSLESPLYTFQKLKDVPSLWMSMSAHNKNQSDTSNSTKRKLFAEKQMKKRRSENNCASSLLKLTPLRGIGLKPLSNNQISPAYEKKLELDANSDKENRENIANSIESPDHQYYTAESVEIENEETFEIEGITVEQLQRLSKDHKQKVLSDFIVDINDLDSDSDV